MPARTPLEKAQRRLEAQQKREARKAAKEAKEAEKAASPSATPQTTTTTANTSTATATARKSAGGEPIILKLMPEVALQQVYCFLTARDLGCTISTCSRLNKALGEARVGYIMSRLSEGRFQLCLNQNEARFLIQDSFAGGETQRLTTKRSSADEFVGYARFLQECVTGYSTLSVGSKSNPIHLPPFVNGRMASVSPEHSVCRVGGDGSISGPGGSGVASWGVGKRGQLGHGNRDDIRLPKLLLGGVGYSSGVRIVQVSAGGGLVRVAHTLLLTSTGRVLSFGNGQYGQLGHGYCAGKQLPDGLRPQYVDVLNGVRCICVSAGELHSAAVTADGDLYTWGDGFCGQLGHGDKRPILSPKQVESGGLEDECVSMVSCGNRHTLVVTEDGEVFSFGLGHFGVLGRAFTPFEYDADAALMAFPGGGEHGEEGFMGVAPAVMPDAEAAAASPPANADEQEDRFDLVAHLDLISNLTLEDSSDQCIPTLVDSLKGINIVGVCAGHRHSMFLDDRGSLYTCGSGVTGALGLGDLESQMFPMKVMEFVDNNVQIMQMSAGVDISMAVSTSGVVYAWGKSEGGRIGLGMMSEIVNTPRRVQLTNKDGDEPFKAVDVECGYVHSLIVGLNGTLRICGGIGIDGEADGVKGEISPSELGKPVPIDDFNIWHRRPEPKEDKAKKQRWQKYGKYELKGRSKMMAEQSG